MKRTPLLRRTPLRARSRKTAREYTERRELVAWLLHAYPICQVPWCTHPSEDIHEPLTRARGGSITDPDNAVAVCRMHHDLIHLEPAWAYEHGLLKHSWEGA